MSLIFLPLMPPFAFVQATASRTPLANGLPTSDVSPVRSKLPPTLISCARAVPASSMPSASSPTIRIVLFMRPPGFAACETRCGDATSVREGVELPVVADRVPPGGHAVRLEEEEEQDREAEHA